ncbi:aldo/keto reductase [Defluviitalea phaphyphila]|uniref:aldo/keto reductase n=1 Tax=Defluviitalea phaphyphila TaxID=1473580 RepID=UPI000A8C264B|nr:aldo/keto reductase [Defluviitalea phaphyphila]
MDIKSTVTLHNGVKMPLLGFGTFKIPDGEEVEKAVLEALKVGYRHIDTAAAYQNEVGVGKAIKASGIKREEIFITSKVWNKDQGYDTTLRAFEETIKRLDTDYLDLYLIHWPKPISKETWKAMEKLYKEKRIRAIGVSNFQIHHLEDLMKSCEIIPMVNQVEYHPQLSQKELLAFCQENKIQLEAWAPLMQGKIFNIPLMQELSQKYNKTIAQIALRWDIQTGVVTIPKSVNASRIKENADIFDFEISEEDMKKIEKLNTGERVGSDPDKIYLL